MILSKIELNQSQYILSAELGETSKDFISIIDKLHENAINFIAEDDNASRILLTENRKSLTTNLFWAEYIKRPNLVFFVLDERLMNLQHIKNHVLNYLEELIDSK